MKRSYVKLMEWVKDLLHRHPTVRDSDDRLIALLWHFQAIDQTDINKLHADAFLRMLYHGKFYSAEAITRCRRKVQEENPELRGQNYLKRKSKTNKYPQQLKNEN
jgi:hypothetical protein